MAYSAREIKDRVAVGDDLFYIEPVGDGRNRLVPAPDSVIEVGTDINKALLQLMEDRIVLLLNTLFNHISTNPFAVTFESIDGMTVTGVWNVSHSRIEC